MKCYAIWNQVERECLVNGSFSAPSVSFLIFCKLNEGGQTPYHIHLRAPNSKTLGLAGFHRFGDCPPLFFKEAVGAQGPGAAWTGVTQIYSGPLIDSAGDLG